MIPTSLLLRQALPPGWQRVRLRDLLRQADARMKAEPDTEYKMAGVKWYGEGVFHRETVRGDGMSANHVAPLVPGALIYNRLFAWKASFAVVPPELGDCFVSNEFPQFVTDSHRLLPDYLYLFCTRETTVRAVSAASTGSAAVSRNRFKEEQFLGFEIALPPLKEQAAIVARWRERKRQIAAARARIEKLEGTLPGIVYRGLGTPPPLADKPVGKCFALPWKELERWSFNYLSRARQGLLGFAKSKFPIVPLGEHLIETMNGYCIKPVAGPTPHKMLKLNALAAAGLDLTKSKFIKIPDKIAERFSIRKGDLFICRSVGSYDHVAKCALAKDDAPSFVFPDTIIRARFKDSLLSEYVGEVIQTPLGRAFFQSNARTAVGMWKIGAEDIGNFPIPLPPVLVQREIMARVQKGRAEIARERETAARLTREIAAEVEALILGEKKLDRGLTNRISSRRSYRA
ncbi:MAG: restriction endonuclease subunit S [Chthoniobacterales bacterium]|nr:restriction endonuclease subunit S [Chthoniobacterales bacterium]